MNGSIRFFIVGYVRNKGYAIKDLQDNSIEFFSKSKVIELSKSVQIYGVKNNEIDLDWFMEYYARAIMAYGEFGAIEKTGMKLSDSGGFMPCFKTGVEPVVDFFEMTTTPLIGVLNNGHIYNVIVIPNEHLYDIGYLYLDGKFSKELVIDLPYCCINKLNIENVLYKNANLYFHDLHSPKRAVVYDLKMGNCEYIIQDVDELYLVKSRDDAKVIFWTSRASTKLYVCKGFNLDKLEIKKVESAPEIYVEVGVDVFKLLRLFINEKWYNLSSLQKKVKNFKFDRHYKDKLRDLYGLD